MKTTFNGQIILMPKQPTPKVNQIWQSEKGELIKITGIEKINKEPVSAWCVKENGERFGMGFGWFNGSEYSFVGTVIL